MPGHSTKRIADFLNGQQLVGDGEQYATTMALMANALGYPSRVVFGAVPEANGVVKGKDVAAWAEVDFAGVGWVPFDATPPQSQTPKPQPPQEEQGSDQNQVVPPPPVAAPPPANNPSQTSTADKDKPHAAGRKSGGGVVPHWVVAGATYGGPPIGLVVVFVGFVLALKWWRRRRRRLRGPVTRRLAGGWHEAVDVARDFGVVVPPRRTRREQAAVIADAQLEALARHADAVIFGPRLPQDADVDDYWAQVDAALGEFRRGASRWRRLKAAISLRSLVRATNANPSARGVSVPRQRANPDAVDRDLVGSR